MHGRDWFGNSELKLGFSDVPDGRILEIKLH